MKRFALLILVLVVASVAFSILVVFAQASTSSWPFFSEVNPRPGTPGIYDLVVPSQVMDRSREDLADLRLYDAKAREIPYALRIRKEVDESREMEARLFNQASVGSTRSEMSVDLGANAGEHNEVEIDTTGTNFRRRVNLEGSDTGTEWRMLKTGDVIFGFEFQNKAVDSKRVSYPTSRYRYLRVTVFADELTDKQAPVITSVNVMMAVREPGQLTTWNVALPSYEPARREGAPASAWTIDLGARVPCDRLMIEVDNESFSRPFQVEAIDDPQNIRLVASGELTRRIGEERRPLVITFNQEQQARKLRLFVIDYSNQMLSLTSIKAAAPARQLVFELKEAATPPLRLFFGNLKATEPHYDFEKELSARLLTAPVRTEVGLVAANPDYKPELPPLTERIPWLIYVVLAASSLALAVILLSLARTTLRNGPQPSEEQNIRPGTD